MKRIVLAVVMLLAVQMAFADNSVRIKELTDENQSLSGKVEQAQRFIQQAQVKIISNGGAIAELQRQDVPKEEPKNKKEAK